MGISRATDHTHHIIKSNNSTQRCLQGSTCQTTSLTSFNPDAQDLSLLHQVLWLDLNLDILWECLVLAGHAFSVADPRLWNSLPGKLLFCKVCFGLRITTRPGTALTLYRFCLTQCLSISWFLGLCFISVVEILRLWLRSLTKTVSLFPP